MQVLVTGATGTLGKAVVRRLGEEGHVVSVLSRRPFLASQLGTSVSVHEWHPLSEPVPPEAVERAEAVLHLMGAPLSGLPSRDAAADPVASRINCTRRLVDALRGRPIRLVAASMAIAPAEAGPPVTDNAPPTAIGSALEQDIGKWETEAAAGAEQGMSVAIVRFGLIAMPGGALTALHALARRGLCPNLGGAYIPAIASDDAVAMLSGLLQQRTLEGLVHGVAPEPLSGEHLMRALRRHAPGGRAVTVPVSLLRRRLGLTSAILSCHRRIVPDRLQAAGAAFTSPDPAEAMEQALDSLARDHRVAQFARGAHNHGSRPATEPT